MTNEQLLNDCFGIETDYETLNQNALRSHQDLVNRAVNLLASLQGEPDNLNSQVALVYVLRELERQQAAREAMSSAFELHYARRDAHQNKRIGKAEELSKAI